MGPQLKGRGDDHGQLQSGTQSTQRSRPSHSYIPRFWQIVHNKKVSGVAGRVHSDGAPVGLLSRHWQTSSDLRGLHDTFVQRGTHRNRACMLNRILRVDQGHDEY